MDVKSKRKNKDHLFNIEILAFQIENMITTIFYLIIAVNASIYPEAYKICTENMLETSMLDTDHAYKIPLQCIYSKVHINYSLMQTNKKCVRQTQTENGDVTVEVVLLYNLTNF